MAAAYKPIPDVPDFGDVEGAPLLPKEAVVAALVAPEPRSWKHHILNPFGDCGVHDWSWCCLAQFVPCLPFGMNMRRSLRLSWFLQALLYLALFGGVSRVVNVTVEAQCPLYVVNPEYVKLHGEPDFPPPPPLAALAPRDAAVTSREEAPPPKKEAHQHVHAEVEILATFTPTFTPAKKTEEVEKPAAVPMTEGYGRGKVAMSEMEPAVVTKEAMAQAEAEAARKAAEADAARRRQAAEPSQAEAVAPPEVPAEAAAEAAAVVAKIHEAFGRRPFNGFHHGKFAIKDLEDKARAVFGKAKGTRPERRGLHESARHEPHHGDRHAVKPTWEVDGVQPYLVNERCAKWHLMSLVGVVCAVVGAAYAGVRRTQIRERFGIEGSPACDFLAWLCVPCCALAQESRTLSHHNVEDGEWPEEEAQVLVAPASVTVVL